MPIKHSGCDLEEITACLFACSSPSDMARAGRLDVEHVMGPDKILAVTGRDEQILDAALGSSRCCPQARSALARARISSCCQSLPISVQPIRLNGVVCESREQQQVGRDPDDHVRTHVGWVFALERLAFAVPESRLCPGPPIARAYWLMASHAATASGHSAMRRSSPDGRDLQLRGLTRRFGSSAQSS